MLETLKEQWRNLQKEQKISVCLLGVCGVLVVGLSFYKLQMSVVEPFLTNNKEMLASKILIGQTPADLEALQKRTDTDGDGLSDWDEVNVYKMNPNLRDSCGDGVLDNIRVVTGKNINCTAQRIGVEVKPVTNGDAAATGTSLTFGAVQSLYPGIPVSDLLVPSQQDSASLDTDLFAPSAPIGGTPEAPLPRNPMVIRDALKGKVDEAILNKTTDADLLKLYDEAIAVRSGEIQTSSQIP